MLVFFLSFGRGGFYYEPSKTKLVQIKLISSKNCRLWNLKDVALERLSLGLSSAWIFVVVIATFEFYFKVSIWLCSFLLVPFKRKNFYSFYLRAIMNISHFFARWFLPMVWRAFFSFRLSWLLLNVILSLKIIATSSPVSISANWSSEK